MACYHPIPARQDRAGDTPELWPPLGTENLELPCGKCLGCRQTHATQWARRCEHEAHQWRHNSFLTLTYDDAHLPEEGHLQPRHLQLFVKRLRKAVHQLLVRHPAAPHRRHTPRERTPPRDPRERVVSDPRASLRYFACGEYGEEGGRPHYHLLIFNADFGGPQIGSSHGEPLRTSDLISTCWSHPRTKEPYGFHTVATARPGAVAGYIAKYALKYQHRTAGGLTDQDGVWKPAPFLRMSLRPAIGKEWLEKHHTDLTRGYLVQNGHQQQIPRYYRKILQQWSELPLYRITGIRMTEADIENYIDQYTEENTTDKNTPERRHDAELIHEQAHKNKHHRL